MRRIIFIFCVLLFLPAISPSSSMGAFSDNLIGARALGMGGAFSTISDDADGILLNPAALTNVRSQQLSATAASIYSGLSDKKLISQGIIGYSNSKSNRASVGFAWKNLNAANLYFENILVVGIAKSYKYSVQPANSGFSMGASFKSLNWDSAATIGSNGDIVEDLSGWKGVSFDAGLIIHISKNTAAGISLQNLNSPSIVSKNSLLAEKLPINVILGVGTSTKNVAWAIDFSFRQNEVDVRTGIELNGYEGRATLRVGFRLENLAWGTNITLGGSIKPSNSIRVDYAFVLPVGNIENTRGSHRVSLVYDF